jgi:hypothetical protein
MYRMHEAAALAHVIQVTFEDEGELEYARVVEAWSNGFAEAFQRLNALWYSKCALCWEER